MRTTIHRVPPAVQHQRPPVLRTREQASAHPAEDAFDAGRIGAVDAECVTAAVTNSGRRDGR